MASGGHSLNLVLLGKTGHGKSSTGNSILSRVTFEESDNFVLETKICTLECSFRDDTLIRVVDTPGLMDTKNTTEFTLSQIGQAMSLLPGGFNAIIFVVSYGIRFSEEEKEVFDTLKQYFGENILRKFGVIVMSHGDLFRKKYNETLTFKAWLNEQQRTCMESPFVKLLNECNNRCVLFYNSGHEFELSQEKSVKKMFHFIDSEIPEPYTSHHFEKAKTTREALVRKLQAPALCAKIQEKLSLLMDRLNSDMKKNVVSYDDMIYKIKEIENELVSLNNDSKEFHDFKRQIDGLTQKLKQIKDEKNDKVRQNEQRQMMKDLETIKNPPGLFKLLNAKIIYSFTKVFTTVGDYVTFRQFKDTFKTMNDRQERNLNKISKMTDEYEAALNRLKMLNFHKFLFDFVNK